MSRSLFLTIETYLTPFFLRAVYAACATSSRASAYICYGRSHFSLFLTLIQSIFTMSSSARIICKDTSRLWPKTLSIGSFSVRIHDIIISLPSGGRNQRISDRP